MKKKLFIGSSKNGLKIAYAIQENLSKEFEVIVWDQGVFELSQSTLESLMEILNEIDIASFLFIPEDVIKIENRETLSVRDNVIFELGLFLGKLGRNKVSFVVPENTNSIHLPTDLLGITYGIYDDKASNLTAAVGTYCNQIRKQADKYLNFDFPVKGKYGLNILHNENQRTSEEDCSINAIVPKGKSLKIIFSKIEGDDNATWGFKTSYQSDWKIKNLIAENKTQSLITLPVTSPDTCISFHGKGKILIECFDATIETKIFSKEFSWDINHP